MIIKRKSILIVAASSTLIALVLVLTLFGFYAYLEWEEAHSRRNYTKSLYDLNGRVFRRFIVVALQARIADAMPFSGKPVVAGTIKNNSNKTIYSLKMKIALHDSAQRVVYIDTFYPIGLERESIIDTGHTTRNFLLQGDSLSFTHYLKKCPLEVVEHLASQLKFAKEDDFRPLELKYTIEELDIR